MASSRSPQIASMRESRGSSMGLPALCQLANPCAGDCHANEKAMRCTSGVHQPSGPPKSLGGEVGIARVRAGSLNVRQTVGSQVVHALSSDRRLRRMGPFCGADKVPAMLRPVGAGGTPHTNRHVWLMERRGVQVALGETPCEHLERRGRDGLDQLVPRSDQQPLRLSHVGGDRVSGIPQTDVFIKPDNGQVGIIDGQPRRGCRMALRHSWLVALPTSWVCAPDRNQPHRSVTSTYRSL